MLRRLLNLSLLIETIDFQRELIGSLRADLGRTQLECTRSLVAMATAFRLAADQPDVDIRDDLDVMIRELSSQVAKMEEHVL